MVIDKNGVYSIKEVASILNIHPRKLNRLAVKQNLKKLDNRYLFSGDFLIKYFNLTNVEGRQTMSKDVKPLLSNETSNATSNEPTNEPINQLDLQVQSLQIENENLKHQVDDLKKELLGYDVKEGERIEVFTDAEYEVLEQRLIEWRTLQNEIEHKQEVFSLKEQHFNTENKTLSKSLKHYKNQFEYQKKQSTKILDMHQTLIDTIQKQSTITIQRNTIEAIEKNVVNPDTWKPNK